MLPNTLAARLFIQSSICLLRAFTPCCLLYVTTSLFLPSHRYRSLALDILAVVESIFFLAVYIPRKHILQRPCQRRVVATEAERDVLFEKWWTTTTDPAAFVSLWFKGYPLHDIRRDDVKDWLSWAFLNTRCASPVNDAELERYLERTERVINHHFTAGSGKHQAMRPTSDRIKMQHRSLTFYACLIGFVDTMCFIFMPLYRFQFNRLSLQKTLACLPFRFLAPFAAQQSPAEHTSYWHREHTSETRLPVLFLHGIGVGLHTYLPFFKEFAASDSQTPADQIGMIAIEIMSINSRMTHAALCKQQQMDEIVAILDKHSWKEFVIVAHSYGTVLATHMLRDSRLHSRVAAMVLADPAAFSSHTPDGTEVFQWMVPKTASQHQLNYFACMDMGVAHTLCRRFLWQENLLWVEDLQHKPVVITLAGKDEVINTRRIAGYLSRSGMDIVQVDEQGLDVFAAALRREQKVIWLPSVNHAEVFDTKRRRGLLLAAMFGYCRR